jgi:hypothetical protein
MDHVLRALFLCFFIFVTVSSYSSTLYKNDVVSEDLQSLTVEGPTSACVNASGTFTVVSTITNGYTWTLPAGMTILSGLGSNSITVRFSTPGMGQYISVSRGASVGGINISVYSIPSGTGILNGPATVCLGQTNVTYSISGVSPVSTYSWFATNGATITSGNNTSIIKVSFPSSYTNGTIGITRVNGSCPPAPTVTKAISGGAALPEAPGQITGQSVKILIGLPLIFQILLLLA